MVVLKMSGALGVVALGAGMLVAAPTAAGTGAGSAFGLAPSTAVVREAGECVGVAPTYADVLVRPAWTEKIEHEATWLTEARYARWVVDQEYRPAVPEIAHDETVWSVEPLAGWTATGESRPVLVRPGTPGVPEVPAVTEQRLVDPGQPYVAPTVQQIHHEAEYTTVHHPAVYETVQHPAVYETIHHDAVIRYEFRQKNGSATRWEIDPDWNSESNSSSVGWEATGVSEVLQDAWVEQRLVSAAWEEEILVTAAWDEQVLVKEAWVEEVLIDPGQEYVPPTYETIVVTPYQPAVPALPDEWGTELEYTRRVVTQEALPEVPESGHLEEQWSTEPPAEGWEATGETRQIVDEPAWTEEIHHPAVYENTMVDPGVVCPGPDSGGDTGGVGGDTGGPGVPGGSGGIPGGRPGTVVTVPVSSPTVRNPAVESPEAGSPTVTRPSSVRAAAALPSTGVGDGLLAVAAVAVASGTALLAFRAWAARIADGSGRHRDSLARGVATTAGALPVGVPSAVALTGAWPETRARRRCPPTSGRARPTPPTSLRPPARRDVGFCCGGDQALHRRRPRRPGMTGACTGSSSRSSSLASAGTKSGRA
ncbi:hypothetical protein [Georgenia sp. SUBG003]|uniref:hypothetical protein n=1 Tax=Georgenia sp. SUBG003 TaxID=1497974 RepID=UPI003AB118EE